MDNRVFRQHLSSRPRGRLLQLGDVPAARWLRLGSALMLLAVSGCRRQPSAELGAKPSVAASSARPADWLKRDSWQRPAQVMDALALQPGSVVADVGAGEGYFTFHLAERVAPHGKVYAEDVRDDSLAKIRERAKSEGFSQIETIVGTESDPGLPAETLDAILIVNAYHEMANYDAMLTAMVRSLKPGGFLAIIDPEGEPNQPRSSYFNDHKMTKQLVREDTARNHLRFVREEKSFDADDSRHLFFLIFEKLKP